MTTTTPTSLMTINAHGTAVRNEFLNSVLAGTRNDLDDLKEMVDGMRAMVESLDAGHLLTRGRWPVSQMSDNGLIAALMEISAKTPPVPSGLGDRVSSNVLFEMFLALSTRIQLMTVAIDGLVERLNEKMAAENRERRTRHVRAVQKLQSQRGKSPRRGLRSGRA